ncbi:MAG: uracil permease [Firmicutes bacterium HGW-Firmicutes-1]|jgi:uracil permease|nr:MAG: uracil permease [Firmicutes bacterium HGW-Firmicutes-1]
MQRKVIQVEEKVPFLQGLPLSFQHLFAMFGASVLVPFLLNDAAQTQVVDPSLVLLMNGIGTLLYIFLCKGKSPAFLGSSFAFIGPAILIITSSSDVTGNYSNVLGGFIVSALIFCSVALIVRVVGTNWLNVVLPPAAMGPIVALIGLDLAHTATGMAGLNPSDGIFDTKTIIVSLFTLAVVILGTLLFRGFFSIIPILFGVLSGYTLAAFLGMVDFTKITGEGVQLLTMPNFVMPTFDITAIMIIIPATLVVISEHIGHLFVTGNIVGRDLTKDPGLHRSLLGDGLSSLISGFAGSVPTTTYGENMGVMAITKVYSVWVIGGAGIISIILAFFGNLSGAISSIPVPVMGGICILLFGVIAASGIRMIVEAKVDYSNSKNLILTSVILIVGISQVAIKIGSVELKGMVLATIVGMLLSLMIYTFDKLKLTNDN